MKKDNMKMIRCCFFFLLFSLSTSIVSAQSYYSVQIYIEKAYISNYLGDEYGPRIRLYKDQWIDQSGYALWLDDNCVKLPNTTYGLRDVNKTYYTWLDSSDPEFDLIVVTHEERKSGSDDCTVQDISSNGSFNKPDRYQTSTTKHINLNDYSPGVYSSTFTVRTVSGDTYVDTYLKIRYTPVPLNRPSGESGQQCSNEDFTINTSNSFVSATNTTGLLYDWEYHISGDTKSNPDLAACIQTCEDNLATCENNGYPSTTCYSSFGQCQGNCNTLYPAQVDNWVAFKTTSTPSLTFNPLNDIFGTLTATTDVQFRVKARGAETAGDVSAGGTYFSFTPPPPSSSSSVVTEKSCTESATGKITLTNISSAFSSYRYILKRSDIASLDCDPKIGNCLAAGDVSGQNSGSTLVIDSLAYGTYSLFLLNNGGVQGVCPRRIGSAISIDTVTRIGINPLSPVNLTCNGVNEGSVSVTIFNGKQDAVNYSLQNITTVQNYSATSNTSNATVIFSSLAAGSYKLNVDDGCTPVVTKTFDITQPVKVDSTAFDMTAATCNDPGNGFAQIKVTRLSGTLTQSVSNIFSCQVYKNNVLYKDEESTSDVFSWNDLPPDSYKVIVKEKGGLDCNAITNDFTIAAADAIDLKSQSVKNVSCFDGTDGEIKVEGQGGTGTFTYYLSGDTTLSNTSGDFTSLRSGNYVVTIKNTIACNDKYVSATIPITHPSELKAVISKKDISCFGLTDGEAYSAVTGGTGGYSYLWEMNINSSWVSMSITTPNLTGRGEGDYRLNVKDDNQCTVVSNQVSIIEPAILNIDSVHVNDIKCFAEKGTIAIYSSGGITPYSYEYALNNSSSHTTFDSTTLLGEGTYHVRVKDKNNCSYQYPDDLVITAPSSPLDFTAQLSDFHGFNISCFGGSNGSAGITATGGNGASYAGYAYSVDAGTYQTDPNLQGINAGSHTLNVKDARACVISKSIVFTQTSARLTPVLVQKKDVICYGDANGSIEMSGSGGLSPYQYSINGSMVQDNGLFEGLDVGDYTITISDKNKCENSLTETITTLDPVMVINASVKDVNCFEGHDGSIELTINGGSPPFQYKWKDLGSTVSVATELTTGTYDVEVTDSAGCKMSATNFVSQPASSLRIGVLAIPVCYDRTDGRITIDLAGGTPPYFYSIDDGNTYQTAPLFPAVGVGNYKIKGKDNNDCSITAEAEVIQRNDKPEPNFLVATKRNALDTLVVTDISVPKPDSIIWSFDAKATVISNDPWDPQIKFNEPGTYTVMMTGFFGGCDYAVTKEIFVSPFDPNATPDKNPSVTPITNFAITPNPSTGEFEVAVTLNKKRNLSIVVYDMIGAKHYEDHWESVQEVKQKITLDNISSGVFLVRAITETDAEDARLVINK